MRTPYGPILTPASVGNRSNHRRSTEPVFKRKAPPIPAFVPIARNEETESGSSSFLDDDSNRDDFEDDFPAWDSNFGGDGGVLVEAS